MRQLAHQLVDMRRHFTTPDGLPDTRGRAWQYRQHVGEVYRGAGWELEKIPEVQSAVRYHIGNVIRDLYTSEELAAVGMREDPPRERVREVREKRAALLAGLANTPNSYAPDRLVLAVANLLEATTIVGELIEDPDGLRDGLARSLSNIKRLQREQLKG